MLVFKVLMLSVWFLLLTSLYQLLKFQVSSDCEYLFSVDVE
jgi:hypothetical protein